jgi:hypothetical protein
MTPAAKPETPRDDNGGQVANRNLVAGQFRPQPIAVSMTQTKPTVSRDIKFMVVHHSTMPDDPSS